MIRTGAMKLDETVPMIDDINDPLLVQCLVCLIVVARAKLTERHPRLIFPGRFEDFFASSSCELLRTAHDACKLIERRLSIMLADPLVQSRLREELLAIKAATEASSAAWTAFRAEACRTTNAPAALGENQRLLRAWTLRACEEVGEELVHSEDIIRGGRANSVMRAEFLAPELSKVEWLLGEKTLTTRLRATPFQRLFLEGDPNASVIADALACAHSLLGNLRRMLAHDSREIIDTELTMGTDDLRQRIEVPVRRIEARMARIASYNYTSGTGEPLRSSQCKRVLGVTPKVFRAAFPDRKWLKFSVIDAMHDLGLNFVLPPADPEYAESVGKHRIEVYRGILPLLVPQDNEPEDARHYVLYLDPLRRDALARDLKPMIDWPFIDAVVRARGLTFKGSLGDRARPIQIAVGPRQEPLGARIVGEVPTGTPR